ncbi:hypothetical protein Naga_100744g2 [Nannochloropsis gaditana]|uniref:Uncharacterized protein n=1 Tax=Nannochloropsis gaditana TaxID=72520 RepID=W7U9N2_9STRA|nr:hypothetical protein Naga_100744g2 [Nannochloropsis gaditana]
MLKGLRNLWSPSPPGEASLGSNGCGVRGGVTPSSGQRGSRKGSLPRAAAAAALLAFSASPRARASRRVTRHEQRGRSHNRKRSSNVTVSRKAQKEKQKKKRRRKSSSPSPTEEKGVETTRPDSNAPTAFLGKAEQAARNSGVVTLADYEMGCKRQRRTRPLDLDRPMPVIVAGRRDEQSTIQELLSLPGLPHVEAPESVRNVECFQEVLDRAPQETAFLPGPGMVLTDLKLTAAETEMAAAMKEAEVTTPHFAEVEGEGKRPRAAAGEGGGEGGGRAGESTGGRRRW